MKYTKAEEKKLVKELFSIPNIIGYFRIIMLPVFLYGYYHAESVQDYIVMFVFLAVIFASDALDGFIARKYNMVTDFGKILDPVSDKLLQCALAVAVIFRHPFMKVFFVVFFCKEFYMGVMGLYLLKKKNSINGAQWYGKICTAFVDICILLLLFVPTIPEPVCSGMILFMIALEFFSLAKYIMFHIGIIKEK